MTCIHMAFFSYLIARLLLRVPESVESIIRTVYRKDRRSSIRFCDPSISFEDDNFRPNFIVYLIPFI